MCGTEVFAEEARRQALRVALMDRETDEQEFIGTLWTGAPQRGDPPLRCGMGADHTHPTEKLLREKWQPQPCTTFSASMADFSVDSAVLASLALARMSWSSVSQTYAW